MAELLGIGTTDMPFLRGNGTMGGVILNAIQNGTHMREEDKNPANWPEPMREEWGEDEGLGPPVSESHGGGSPGDVERHAALRANPRSVGEQSFARLCVRAHGGGDRGVTAVRNFQGGISACDLDLFARALARGLSVEAINFSSASSPLSPIFCNAV